MYPLSNSNPVFEVLSTWKLHKNKNTTGYMWTNFIPVALWDTQINSVEHLMTSSKTFKLQTRKIHQTETVIFIPPSRDASNFSPETFKTNFSPNSEAVFIICSKYQALFFFCYHRNTSH